MLIKVLLIHIYRVFQKVLYRIREVIVLIKTKIFTVQRNLRLHSTLSSRKYFLQNTTSKHKVSLLTSFWRFPFNLVDIFFPKSLNKYQINPRRESALVCITNFVKASDYCQERALLTIFLDFKWQLPAG